MMAGSSNAELADLLNEMLSVQEKLRKRGISFGTGLPGAPAGQPEAAASSSYAPAGTPASGTTTHTTGLQHRADLFPTFWGEPVSAFHGRMGYSANTWLRDPRSASASASSASPAAPQLPVDASPDAFPEPVQTMVWRCRGLCMDCKKACCGKSDEDYDKVKWRKNHRCNYCWTVWKAEHR